MSTNVKGKCFDKFKKISLSEALRNALNIPCNINKKFPK